MAGTNRQLWQHTGILFLMAVLAFFPVVMNIHPVKWDMIDCFYPWRFHIGECLQNGQLPWWNPYQDLGYPIHADPSSGAWYPMVWLIGSTVGYSIWTIGFELWIHVFFAGVGMYFLAKTLKFDPRFALMAGIAYMLSGFFIGNAQHLPYIISACWLPYVLTFYLKMRERKGWQDAVKLALFLFLMITGGYPAITIILFYLLLIFFSVTAFKFWREKDYSNLFAFIGRNVLLTGTTVLTSAAMLMSVAVVSPYLSRLGNFDLQQALFSPFSPQSFFSFIVPYSTTANIPWFNSDLSMRNGYFGLIVLIFFVLGTFRKKPIELRIFFWFGILCLCAAVGEYLPVREFLFRYVPMMNVFRFPSVFRLFFILGAVLTGVWTLQHDLLDDKRSKRTVLMALGISLCAMLAVIVAFRLQGFLAMGTFLKLGIFSFNVGATFAQLAVFQAAIQVISLGIGFMLFWKVKNANVRILSISVLIATDLLIASSLNGPATVYYGEVEAKVAQANVDKYPHGFPKQLDISIDSAGHLLGIGTPYWQNLQTFQKQISAEGYNSFSFTSYEQLESEFPNLYAAVKKCHLLTLSDRLLQNAIGDRIQPGELFVQFGSDRHPGIYALSKGDTALLESYNANEFHVSASVKRSCLLTLHQKDYSDWRAFVDGKETPILVSNMNFMTIELPAGKSKVRFVFDNTLVRIAFYVSISSLVFALFMLVRDVVKQRVPR
jgi:hypothetical protein